MKREDLRAEDFTPWNGKGTPPTGVTAVLFRPFEDCLVVGERSKGDISGDISIGDGTLVYWEHYGNAGDVIGYYTGEIE